MQGEKGIGEPEWMVEAGQGARNCLQRGKKTGKIPLDAGNFWSCPRGENQEGPKFFGAGRQKLIEVWAHWLLGR